jgi:hypothetical protein
MQKADHYSASGFRIQLVVERRVTDRRRIGSGVRLSSGSAGHGGQKPAQTRSLRNLARDTIAELAVEGKDVIARPEAQLPLHISEALEDGPKAVPMSEVSSKSRHPGLDHFGQRLALIGKMPEVGRLAKAAKCTDAAIGDDKFKYARSGEKRRDSAFDGLRMVNDVADQLTESGN